MIRLGLTALLCGLVGLERESRDQAAGLRTHILVGVGAALFTIISAYGFTGFTSATASGTVMRADPTRIAAQIVTGIGFLGAGAIMRHGLNVRGLTTAAALWVVAAVGIAVGAGAYFAATATTAIVLITLVGLRLLRRALLRRLGSDFLFVELELSNGRVLAKVLEILADFGARVERIEIEEVGSEQRAVTLELRIGRGEVRQSALHALGALDGVRAVSSGRIDHA